MTNENRQKPAYDHSSKVVGGAEGETASTEHQEPARGGGEAERNELRPEERATQDGYGPRTHEATRTTRKGED